MDLVEMEETSFIADTAAKFAQAELVRLVSARREGGFDREAWTGVLRKGAELGFFSAPLPADLGGSEMDTLSEAVLVSGLARGCAGFAATLAVHFAAIAGMKAFGESREFSEIRSALAEPAPEVGPRILSLALAEEVYDAAGSEAGSFLALLNPDKAFLVVLVDPRGGILPVSPAELTDKRRPAYPGSGLDEMAPCRIAFNGLEAVSPGSSSVKAAASAVARLKLLLAAVQHGNAEGAHAEAAAYARERVQTGRRLADHQEVRKVLLRSEMMLEALESYLFRTAVHSGLSDGGAGGAARLFRFAARAAEEVCLDAMQTLGGYGYMKDYGQEKRLRDAKTITALPGSFLSDLLQA